MIIIYTSIIRFTDMCLFNFRPVLGLIFLFKWRPGEERSGELVLNNDKIFFAQQVGVTRIVLIVCWIFCINFKRINFKTDI